MFRRDERELMKQAAIVQKGREWATFIIVAMFIWRTLPFLLAAIVVTGIGYAALLGWRAITDTGGVDLPDMTSPVHAISPTAPLIWIGVVVAIAGAVWVAAPGRYPDTSVRVLRAVATLIVISGLIGIWFGLR